MRVVCIFVMEVVRPFRKSSGVPRHSSSLGRPSKDFQLRLEFAQKGSRIFQLCPWLTTLRNRSCPHAHERQLRCALVDLCRRQRQQPLSSRALWCPSFRQGRRSMCRVRAALVGSSCDRSSVYACCSFDCPNNQQATRTSRPAAAMVTTRQPLFPNFFSITGLPLFEYRPQLSGLPLSFFHSAFPIQSETQITVEKLCLPRTDDNRGDKNGNCVQRLQVAQRKHRPEGSKNLKSPVTAFIDRVESYSQCVLSCSNSTGD